MNKTLSPDRFKKLMKNKAFRYIEKGNNNTATIQNWQVSSTVMAGYESETATQKILSGVKLFSFIFHTFIHEGYIMKSLKFFRETFILLHLFSFPLCW